MKRAFFLAAFLFIASPAHSATNTFPTSGDVGIGTTSPQTLLTINANASGVPGVSGATNNAQIVGADSSNNGLEMDAFGYNSTIFFERYDGTFSSQSALLSGEAIGSLDGGGYNGSIVAPNTVGIIYVAGGNWSTSSEPTYITFGTTAVGSTTKTERMRIDTTGKVGIGTTTPAGTLDVEGGTAAASTNGSSINIVAQSAGTGNQNGGNIILTPGTATGTGTPGAVGIGTTSPGGLLEVYSNNSSGGSGYEILESDTNAQFAPTLQFTDNRTGASGHTYIITNGGIASALTIKDITANTFDLTILGNGNTGIGTASPSYPLDVTGSIRTTQALLNSSAVPTISTCGTSPPAATAGSNNNSGQFTLGTGATTACTVTFANAFPNNAYCTVTPAGSYTGTYYISSQSRSAFTVTLGTGTASVKFNYTCGGN